MLIHSSILSSLALISEITFSFTPNSFLSSVHISFFPQITLLLIFPQNWFMLFSHNFYHLLLANFETLDFSFMLTRLSGMFMSNYYYSGLCN